MLPNFLVLGAQKAGTTTIWDLLNGHPQVYFPKQRETDFFLTDFEYHLGLRHYETAYFADTGDAVAVGEKTPDYLFHPAAAERIRATLGPDLRLIACLRSPAARANSHHRHNFMLYREWLSFDAAIAAEPDRVAQGTAHACLHGYLAKGFYAEQIARYQALFGADKLLVITLDDLRDDQAATLRQICDWIGVDTPAERAPVRRGIPRYFGLEIIDAASGPAIRYLRDDTVVRQPDASHLDFARSYLSAAETLSPLTRADELALNNRVFREDIRKLEGVIGRSLEGWLS